MVGVAVDGTEKERETVVKGTISLTLDVCERVVFSSSSTLGVVGGL